MTTNRFAFKPRTPRKTKAWATQFQDPALPAQIQAVAANQLSVQAELLERYRNDVGLTALQNVTAMRIVGSMHAANGVTESADRNHVFIWGIAWVSAEVAALPAGSATIPDPFDGGAREAEWLQTGALYYRSAGLRLAFGPSEDTANVNLDITQMRKQRTPNDRLVLIIRHNSDGGGTSDPGLFYGLRTMLALP